MKNIDEILKYNKKWSLKKQKKDPRFFKKLIQPQNPNFFWIGCSDSRILLHEITGLKEGEIFILRNIGNLFFEKDQSAMSALDFAINTLKVENIIVCGHYNCGGIIGSQEKDKRMLKKSFFNKWLKNIKKTYLKNKIELDSIKDLSLKENRLSELNVLTQISNIYKTETFKNALNKKKIKIHGLIYDLKTGLLRSLTN